MKKILQLLGVGDNDEVRVVQTNSRYGKPLYFIEGSLPLLKYLPKNLFAAQSLILGGGESGDKKILQPDLVVNAICDPDTHTKSLDEARRIISLVKAPVVNHPDDIVKTARDTLSKLLGDIDGLTVPKTLRIRPRSVAETVRSAAEHGFSFPFLVREAGGQSGSGMVRIDSEKDYGLLERFAMDGRDFYLIQYIDFASKDGMYRKYRFYLIDGKVYPGHLIVSNHWQVHRDSRDNSAFGREEKLFLSQWNKDVVPVFETVAQRLGLDFFGIDCAFGKEGSLLLFEANSCMDIFSGEKSASYYNPKYRKKMQEAILKLINWKIDANG